MQIKQWAKNQKLVAPIARRLYSMFAASTFKGSASYWERRYQRGGNSGAGSFNRLADFKAEFLNEFVAENNVSSVVELGCGDGAQLLLAKYPRYLGLDVAPTAVELCRKRFESDLSKRFELVGHGTVRQELALSLDVIYHLVEDAAYEAYMCQLFGSATHFVIVYSSNADNQPPEPHIRHRRFTTWVEANAPEWKLLSVTKNKYPFNSSEPDNTSFADFFVFSRTPA
jgi:SAM-dependent methyltransferase